MQVSERIQLLARLGDYMNNTDTEEWQQVITRAINHNSWFTEASVTTAIAGIAQQFLDAGALTTWVNSYVQPEAAKKVGIIMAGNIPLVGFHDFLCGFVLGHDLYIKLSTKDNVLLPHLVGKLTEWAPEAGQTIHFADNLKGCDAYIATGSNNSARYFEQYFSKYPNIIRKNRTSVAVLTGEETAEEISLLGRDIFTYYGLGCRNVTKIYVPRAYDFAKLFEGLEGYRDVMLHHKYKNNYDYHLAIYLLNKVPYMTNDFLLLVENELPYSAVSALHYEFYSTIEEAAVFLQNNDNIQLVVDNRATPFGNSQFPTLTDYADGVDTMMFLSQL